MTNNDSNGSVPGESLNGLTRYELSQRADEILRNAQCDIFGNPLSQEDYLQNRFENRMTVCPFRGASRRQ